jgi:hypothetical protein
MTGALGLAFACLCLLFVVWAIGHDWRRIGWHADEQEAEQFSADMASVPAVTYFPPTSVQVRNGSITWYSAPSLTDLRELAASLAEEADRREARHAAHLGES